MIRESVRRTVPGWVMVPVIFATLTALIWSLLGRFDPVPDRPTWGIVLHLVAVALTAAVGYFGFFVVNPNEAKVVQLFGAYAGTVKAPGFHWANPLFSFRRISLRIRNFESSKIKVNDYEGSPIEIGAVVVWRVVETAEAAFEVDDYDHYVKVQTESAIRNLATQYPYDAHGEGQRSLRAAEIADELKAEVQARLAKAGVEVLEARITHLAYSPEIAAAMLQRQQAGAIIAARHRIVEGAVSMVEMALEQLSHRQIVQLDNERKAAMVSNLLVVLCGDRNTQPVINTGTIYQ